MGIFTSASHAQRTIGIQWDMPATTDSSLSQLQQFKTLGISTIEIKELPPPKVWQQIDSLGFSVYANLGITFPTTKTFSEPDSALLSQIQHKASAYIAHSSIQAMGLFNYGAVQQADFNEALKPYISRFKEAGIPSLYVVSSRNIADSLQADFFLWDIQIASQEDLSDIPSQAQDYNGGYIYDPSEELSHQLAPFKEFLSATSGNPQKPVFVSSQWLFSILQSHPGFSEILASITGDDLFIFPLPKEQAIPQERSNSNIPIVILLLVWGSIALHYSGSPLYRKSVFRFFTSHRFFIDDIFHRKIRSPIPAMLLLFQHALLFSACIFSVFSELFSKLGQQALFTYFPFLTIVGSNTYSIFIWTFLAVITVSLISIIWLFISHKQLRQLTQVATIYVWPLHINFLLCTVAITLYASGATKIPLLIGVIPAMILFAVAFMLASFDFGRFVISGRVTYLFLTTGLYVLAVGGGLIWLTTYDNWMDILRLAVNLT